MNAKIAFYKGPGNWIDKIIRLWTKSKYSHVELIYDGNWYGTSPRALKVRKVQGKTLRKNWDYVDVEIDPTKLDNFFKDTIDAKYDWLGIFFSVGIFYNSKFSVQNKKRWFCSEWVAAVLQISKPDKFSPGSLYTYLTTKK